MTDLEREKREMEQSIMRKETEISSLNSKLGEEQNSLGRVQRSIKELTARQSDHLASWSETQMLP